MAAAALTLICVYALARWIPDVADAPLRVVVAQAPDTRVIVGVMVTALALALVLAVAGVVGRGRSRHTGPAPSEA